MQHLFDEIVGEPPVSTIDVASIVKREQRIRTIRRMIVPLTATAVVVLSGVLVGAVPTQPAPNKQAAPPVTTATTDAARFRLVLDSRESAQATAARMAEALDLGVRRVAPQARWLADNFYGAANVDGQLPVIIVGDGRTAKENTLYGGSFVDNGGRKGDVSLQVIGPRLCLGPGDRKCAKGDDTGRVRQWRYRLLQCAREEGPKCSQRTGPNGERIVVRTESVRPPKLTGPWSINSYAVFIGLDGERVLSIGTSNEYGGNAKDGPAQNDPPLTVNQLILVLTYLAGRIAP
jgi:hypothetical protein